MSIGGMVLLSAARPRLKHRGQDSNLRLTATVEKGLAPFKSVCNRHHPLLYQLSYLDTKKPCAPFPRRAERRRETTAATACNSPVPRSCEP